MAELKILGAQRVKALTAMLDEKKKIEISALKETLNTDDQIALKVDNEFGVTDLRKREGELRSQLDEVKRQINEITGENEYTSKRRTFAYYKRTQELQEERIASIAKVEKKYEQKAAELWLCETLEQAKEIVGI